jgi:hypothetical protein
MFLSSKTEEFSISDALARHLLRDGAALQIAALVCTRRKTEICRAMLPLISIV